MTITIETLVPHRLWQAGVGLRSLPDGHGRAGAAWRPAMTPATRHPAARAAGREVALVVVLNGERAYSGRLTAGRAPFEAVIGAGHDAAAPANYRDHHS